MSLVFLCFFISTESLAGQKTKRNRRKRFCGKEGDSYVGMEERVAAVFAFIFDRLLRLSGAGSDVPRLQLPADGPDRRNRYGGDRISAAPWHVEITAPPADDDWSGHHYRSGAGRRSVFSGSSGGPDVGLPGRVDEHVRQPDLPPLYFVLVSALRGGDLFYQSSGLLSAEHRTSPGLPDVPLEVRVSGSSENPAGADGGCRNYS